MRSLLHIYHNELQKKTIDVFANKHITLIIFLCIPVTNRREKISSLNSSILKTSTILL